MLISQISIFITIVRITFWVIFLKIGKNVGRYYGVLSVPDCQAKWKNQFSQLKLVGGCCRTRPMDIARIKKQIGKI
ncbi:homocysteine S-methyltransferase family protein [Streptococcus pluranimalium]|uniref:homocysteine S-methyltransferase family protein n=1 Tax=Streptococcus pluranimalium TaxID=82348 RepID=UPI003F691D73